VSEGVRNASVSVATVRGIFCHLIADVAGEIVVAAVAALVTSWSTAGISMSAFVS
jgi:Co/Zn/Cd efflux system component